MEIARAHTFRAEAEDFARLASQQLEFAELNGAPPEVLASLREAKEDAIAAVADWDRLLGENQ